MALRNALPSLIFKIFSNPLPYLETIRQMEHHVTKMIASEANDEVWLLEHPALYTMGTSANLTDVKNHQLPCYATGRGGQVTYHGPGQRVVYVMLSLQSQDLHQYIWSLEEWLILTLKDLGLGGVRRSGRIGVWICSNDGSEKKIAAIGIRIKKWITFHGVSLNINPDLTAYQGIVPCGLSQYGMTSLAQQGIDVDTKTIDAFLIKNFSIVF